MSSKNYRREVDKYYTTPLQKALEEDTIYDVWERGEAVNDSVTPSSYCQHYRSHMVLKISMLTDEHTEIYSLGCGNGFVEGDLSNKYIVKGIDLNELAVSLAVEKGVLARQGDFYDLTCEDFSNIQVVYADGFVGHLFDAKTGLDAFYDKLEDLKLGSGTVIVVSNDSPQTKFSLYEPHSNVEGFWYVSREYLTEQFSKRNYAVLESYYFPYVRPLSGLRNRSITVAVKH